MFNDKKGMGVEILLRLTAAVIAIVAVSTLLYKFGGVILGASGFNAKLSEQSFNELEQSLNSEDFKAGDSNQKFLNLDKDTAIIGFSKNMNYECHKCYITEQCSDCLLPPLSLLDTVAKFTRPNTPECRDSACVCLCQKDMKLSKISETEYGISCTKLKCEKINHDIYPQINIKYSTFEPNSMVLGSYWKGGFLVARQLSKVDDTSISGIPEIQHTKISVWIEKKIIDTKAYVALCHEQPCIEERK